MGMIGGFQYYSGPQPWAAGAQSFTDNFLKAYLATKNQSIQEAYKQMQEKLMQEQLEKQQAIAEARSEMTQIFQPTKIPFFDRPDRESPLELTPVGQKALAGLMSGVPQTIQDPYGGEIQSAGMVNPEYAQREAEARAALQKAGGITMQPQVSMSNLMPILMKADPIEGMKQFMAYQTAIDKKDVGLELIKGGKYDPDSVARFLKSGDPNDLSLVEKSKSKSIGYEKSTGYQVNEDDQGNQFYATGPDKGKPYAGGQLVPKTEPGAVTVQYYGADQARKEAAAGVYDFPAKMWLLGEPPPRFIGPGAAVKQVEFWKAAQRVAQQEGLNDKQIIATRQYNQSVKSGLNIINRQEAMVDNFERMVQKQLDIVMELNDRTERSGSPVFNRWLLWVKGQGSGDSDVVQFHNAVWTYATEMAKLTTGNISAMGVTEGARQELDKIISYSLTQDNIKGLEKLWRTEAKNRVLSIRESKQMILKNAGKLVTEPLEEPAHVPSPRLRPDLYGPASAGNPVGTGGALNASDFMNKWGR